MLQTTPLAVTPAVQSPVILPPVLAPVDDMPEIVVVDNPGRTTDVVNDISFP